MYFFFRWMRRRCRIFHHWCVLHVFQFFPNIFFLIIIEGSFFHTQVYNLRCFSRNCSSSFRVTHFIFIVRMPFLCEQLFWFEDLSVLRWTGSSALIQDFRIQNTITSWETRDWRWFIHFLIRECLLFRRSTPSLFCSILQINPFVMMSFSLGYSRHENDDERTSFWNSKYWAKLKNAKYRKHTNLVLGVQDLRKERRISSYSDTRWLSWCPPTLFMFSNFLLQFPLRKFLSLVNYRIFGKQYLLTIQLVFLNHALFVSSPLLLMKCLKWCAHNLKREFDEKRRQTNHACVGNNLPVERKMKDKMSISLTIIMTTSSAVLMHKGNSFREICCFVSFTNRLES